MNTKITKWLMALLLSVITITMWSIALKSCDLIKEKPSKLTIENEIRKKMDSVGIAAVMQPDTAKLRKLQALKFRIATAKYNDSLQRAKAK